MADPDEPFTPASPGDLSDPMILPRRFELLAGEVRGLADILNRKVVPALERIIERLDEDSTDIGRLQRDVGSLRDRVDTAQMELVALAGGVR